MVRTVPLSCTLSAFLVTHGVALKCAPSQPALRCSSPLHLLPSLSYKLEMSGLPQVGEKQNKWRMIKKKLTKAYDVVTHHLSKHTGVGFVCAVAYFDP